eukprot:PhF_6_TR35037/c0_g1_i1/m.51053
MGCGSSHSIHSLAHEGNVDEVSRAIQHNPALKTATSRQYFDGTALHAACYSDRVEVVNRLLELGVPLDGVDSLGNNVFHICAKHQSIAIVKFLLAHASEQQVRKLVTSRNKDKVFTWELCPETEIGKTIHTMLFEVSQESSSLTTQNFHDFLRHGGNAQSVGTWYCRGEKLFTQKLRVSPWPFDAPALHISLGFGHVGVAKQIIVVGGEQQLALLDASQNTVLHCVIFRIKFMKNTDSFEFLLSTYGKQVKRMIPCVNDDGVRPLDMILPTDPNYSYVQSSILTQ